MNPLEWIITCSLFNDRNKGPWLHFKRDDTALGMEGWILVGAASMPGYLDPHQRCGTELVLASVDGWWALEDLPVSDHQYITFEMVDGISPRALAQRSPCASNITKVNIGRFVEAFGTDKAALEDTSVVGSSLSYNFNNNPEGFQP